MTIRGRAGAAALAAAAAVVLAVPSPASPADPDIEFANQLHGFGIYGQRDYNAWLGKITCKRLARGVDGDAYASVAFVSKNLPRDTTREQVAQFLGAAVGTYCPDLAQLLRNASG